MVDYTLAELEHRFFYQTMLAGHALFIADCDMVAAYMKWLADKHCIVIDDGTVFRDCIGASMQGRLLRYEKFMRRHMLPIASGIVNLQQNPSWCRVTKGNSRIPTLLTSTSALWSFHHGRLMHPMEKLIAQNVPSGTWGLLNGCLDQSLTYEEVDFMAGNMMNCKQVATSFCWVLFFSRKNSTSAALIPSPVNTLDADRSDEEHFGFE